MMIPLMIPFNYLELNLHTCGLEPLACAVTQCTGGLNLVDLDSSAVPTLWRFRLNNFELEAYTLSWNALLQLSGYIAQGTTKWSPYIGVD